MFVAELGGGEVNVSIAELLYFRTVKFTLIHQGVWVLINVFDRHCYFNYEKEGFGVFLS